MNAKAAAYYSNQRKAIVVFSVHTVLFHAQPFSKTQVVTVRRSKKRVARRNDQTDSLIDKAN
tara:strand:+ start:182113 stop:182298 length:186 start_codon:yes stop_codon:yes gene_type:complete